MAVKPGYKLTEVGVIPEDWEVLPLAATVDFLDGQRRPVKDNDRAKVRGDIPYYGASGIVDYVNNFIFDDTLILLGEDGENIISRNCRLAFIISGKAWVNNHAHVLKPRHGYDIGFLAEYLESLEYEQYNTGTAQPKLNKQVCSKIPVLRPPLPEQTAIATTLSDVDALISSLDALISKKKQIKQGAMQELLSGKRRLPGFSGEWEVKRLGELFTFSGGWPASRDQLSENGYCYLHYGDIHMSEKTYIDVHDEYLNIPKLAVQLNVVNKSTILKDGDIVFVDASEDDEGTSKHLVITNPNDIPYVSGLHTIVAKSKTNRLDNMFKRHCFQSRKIKEQFSFFSVGTKVSGISKSNIVKIELHFPESLGEQTAIATILSDMDAEITALESCRKKNRALKQGMMQELLTGRIRLPIAKHHMVSGRTNPTMEMRQ